ncbi:MAG: HAD-IIIA family hydrolase [Thermodesulfobacteriota bacterium]|nr:HAD-IIIA family hydrolase [Thermodesulfobacteriota bacterium]
MLENNLKKINLLLLDVDGVLTDGSIIYNDRGEEIKIFNVKDGLGIRLLIEAGIKVYIITGRKSDALKHRCKNLGIDHVFEGVTDKSSLLELIFKQTGSTSEETAFIGDDLMDLSIMNMVDTPIAVADAHHLVIKKASIVTTAKGGQGAVREISEAILKAKGLWEKIIKRYS